MRRKCAATVFSMLLLTLSCTKPETGPKSESGTENEMKMLREKFQTAQLPFGNKTSGSIPTKANARILSRQLKAILSQSRPAEVRDVLLVPNLTPGENHYVLPAKSYFTVDTLELSDGDIDCLVRLNTGKNFEILIFRKSGGFQHKAYDILCTMDTSGNPIGHVQLGLCEAGYGSGSAQNIPYEAAYIVQPDMTIRVSELASYSKKFEAPAWDKSFWDERVFEILSDGKIVQRTGSTLKGSLDITFAGKIDGRFDIVMGLYVAFADSHVSGSYYYKASGENIPLSGLMYPNGVFAIDELDGFGFHEASFLGKLVGNQMHGRWISKSKSFSFHLAEADSYEGHEPVWEQEKVLSLFSKVYWSELGKKGGQGEWVSIKNHHMTVLYDREKEVAELTGYLGGGDSFRDRITRAFKEYHEFVFMIDSGPAYRVSVVDKNKRILSWTRDWGASSSVFYTVHADHNVFPESDGY